MNKKAVANELVKIARSIVADAGDVPIYFNVSDYMKNTKGGTMDADVVEKAKKILSKSIYDISEIIDREVIKSIKKNKAEIESLGLQIK